MAYNDGVTDFLYTGRLDNLDIALSYTSTVTLVNEAVLRHDCDPPAAHILGRALTAAVLSAATLDAAQRLNICWSYPGAVKTVLVDAGADGTARGLISPTHLAEKGDAPQHLFGDRAEVRVVRSREAQVINSGMVESVLQDVVRDLTYFLCTSDQVETEICVMIGFTQDVKQPVAICRGILMQALPPCDLRRFDRIRQVLHGAAARELLSRGGESDSQLENIINTLTADEERDTGLVYRDAPTPTFRCNCSREKIAAVVCTLPYNERMDLVKRRENVSVHCEFCTAKYVLTIDECIAAWNQRATDGPS